MVKDHLGNLLPVLDTGNKMGEGSFFNDVAEIVFRHCAERPQLRIVRCQRFIVSVFIVVRLNAKSETQRRT